MESNGLVDCGDVLEGWNRNGDCHDATVIFTSSAGFFDIVVSHSSGDKYTVCVERAVGHPHVEEIDEPLRVQHAVPEENVSNVVSAFMLTASDMDPFTNRFTRGMRIGGN